jgi:SAM-dependent methyltransferase
VYTVDSIDGFRLACVALGPEDDGTRTSRCRGPLRIKDPGSSLDCASCGAEYVVREGIPVLISHDMPASPAAYDDELLAQAYVEMHFASYRAEPAAVGSDLIDIRDVPVLGRRIHEIRDLTGSFYEAIARIVLAHSEATSGLVADVACGMARMGLELFAAGWTGDYLGIDLSRRLLVDAATVLMRPDPTVRMALPLDHRHGPQSTRVHLRVPEFANQRTCLAVGDGARLPIESESCAVVLALNLVDRVEDPALVVKECWRCVAPGGLLVLADPFDWPATTPADRRFYSFRTAEPWLPGAMQVNLADDERNVTFAIRRREQRWVVFYDDEVALFRRPKPPQGAPTG